MAKFDVYRLHGGGTVIDCQSDLLDDLNTRFVVPLLPEDAAPRPATRLNPLFDVAGSRLVMVTQFAAAVSCSEIEERVATLQREAFTVGNALDILICGF